MLPLPLAWPEEQRQKLKSAYGLMTCATTDQQLAVAYYGAAYELLYTFPRDEHTANVERALLTHHNAIAKARGFIVL